MPYFTYFRAAVVKIGISFDSTQRTISEWKIKEE